MLGALDFLVLMKVQAIGSRDWTQRALAAELGVSVGAVNGALRQGERVGLYLKGPKSLVAPRLFEVLTCGVPYVFPLVRGGEVRGIPTSWAAPPLSERLTSGGLLSPVWPHPQGRVRGIGLEPLHPAVPDAALRDPRLYQMLALIDAIREGGARQTTLAKTELSKLLGLAS